MAINPDVQLYGKLDTIFVGASANIVAQPDIGSIEVALCGYGSQVPRVATEAMLSLVTQAQAVNPATASNPGAFEVNLFSNGIIQPAGTYYTVTIKDDNGDIVQVDSYIFDPGIYDLSTLTPFDPSLPLPPLGPYIKSQLEILQDQTAFVFDGSNYLSFKTILNSNATISVSNAVPGNLYTFVIIQDATGNRQVTWAANFINATPVNPDPNGWTIQTFIYLDDNNFYPISGSTWFTP